MSKSRDPKEYKDARIVTEIKDIKPHIQTISHSKSDLGSGGMKSKLESAGIAQQAGIETWILSGNTSNFLMNAIEQNQTFTKVLAG